MLSGCLQVFCTESTVPLVDTVRELWFQPTAVNVLQIGHTVDYETRSSRAIGRQVAKLFRHWSRAVLFRIFIIEILLMFSPLMKMIRNVHQQFGESLQAESVARDHMRYIYWKMIQSP